MAMEKISLKLSIILNLKRQTSGRHFGPVIQSFDGMFNRALIIKYELLLILLRPHRPKRAVQDWASIKPGTWNIPEHSGTFRDIPEHEKINYF